MTESMGVHELVDLVCGGSGGSFFADGILSCFAGGVWWETPEEFHASNVDPKLVEHDPSRLLELRAYNRQAEIHALRDSIAPGTPLTVRIVDDEGLLPEPYLDEIQYLDIDEKTRQGNFQSSIGGGRYRLPVAAARFLKIRNYVSYDEDGLAHVSDFRIVGISHDDTSDVEG